MTAANPTVRRFPEGPVRRIGWLLATLLAWIAAPYAWQRTVARALHPGAALGPIWPLLTFAIWLATIGLMVRSCGPGAPPVCVQPSGPRRKLFGAGLVLWLVIQFALGRLLASPLGADSAVGLATAASTLWLFWSWAMFLFAGGARTRAGALAAWLLLAGAAIACLRSSGSDGAGRPIISWRFVPTVETTALAASISDRSASTAELPRHDTHDNSPSYPCFRGANGLGALADARLRSDWSATPPRLAWRRAVGTAWGSFAIDAGQVFTQEQRGEMETVACYDLATGRERWSHADRQHFRSAMTGDGPRATPAVAGDGVYSLGATGLLNCLDRRTGKPRWSVDILADNDAGNLMHGLSGSPLVVDRLVVVSAGGGQGKSLAAYERESGRRAWRAGDDPAGYGSPLLCTLAGRRQVVILNRPGLAAHDLETGRVLWTYAWQNSTETNCSQPVPYGENRLFVSSGYGKGCGLLEVEEREAGDWQVRCLWATRSLKTKFASAVLYDGHAYGLDDGILCCVDLADGRRCWKAGRYGHGQVLLAGDKLLVQAESGEAALVAAEPSGHRELGRFAALAGKTWNYPALAGRWLLCRNDREAACFELPLFPISR